ncbi:alternative ribosome rescue aminoacyl-tRNA hydrolase ArfB [Persicirhabdus sediminis]|uniref:Aminoacyl-tRNA hydrolase n=1 Tax=Persicirhabdus sediminis TaxID=454144 RepID=A0A8J7MHE2_9BACT|nr:alternative ribosome rescue aminoacyl-tRNA hydrolase ArfB [Persicirhabdus sediminis]MBK1791944.1 aminoacyl-tRNA hydrolase [Persicirhabdus sediminis]
MLRISNQLTLPADEIEIQGVRSQGAGGQNVNKVSSAAHLRFDVTNSKVLPDFYRERLLAMSDQRLTKDGVIVIKAQEFRSFEKNRDEALRRLYLLIKGVTVEQKKRKATKPTRGSEKRRQKAKKMRSETKKNRGRVDGGF